ncbi:hypothetical protein KEJ26_03860 [Candidatus Bathyarchaeota archaeon]|nr:hypothetical protein [Candidatus Bathyarchaeota archaeon]
MKKLYGKPETNDVYGIRIKPDETLVLSESFITDDKTTTLALKSLSEWNLHLS